MHLTAFHSGKGDCLLLTNAKGSKRALIDGGMPAPYTAHVAPALAKLRAANKMLDVVYVSHIDEDHIGGVLRLLDAEVAWRVHEFQQQNGNKKSKAPTVPRAPEIGEIWHNAFHDQLKDNAGDIEDALAATAPVLSGAAVAELREEGRKQAGFATSIRQAIQVSRRVGSKQLGIPLNKPAKGKLMMVRPGQGAISLGGMQFTVVGPTRKHLKELRDKWNAWLRANKETLSAIRAKEKGVEGRLGTSEFDLLMLTMRLQAEAFGRPESVTPQNLASLMLFVEEGNQSMLLTGDARWDQFVEGLEETELLAEGKTLTIDILKVPHHGSKNNITDTDFLDRVVARDYVFCGNGEHGNPHADVVEKMFRHRLKAAGDFVFWFNSSSQSEEKTELAEHMADLEKLTKQLGKTSKNRFSFRFLSKGSSLQVI